MRGVFLFVLFSFSLGAGLVAFDIKPRGQEDRFMGIRILDSKFLHYRDIQDIAFAGLSDLAYDKRKRYLHLVSDKGTLFTFSTKLSDKIDSLSPLRASTLKGKKGTPFKHWRRDSEGLVLDGHNRLLISFEGKAKVAWFHKNSKKYGRLIRNYHVPKALHDVKKYRSRNKSLEALTWHKKYGILTALEFPLKRYPKKHHRIYSLKGRIWEFKAEPEPNSAIVAMEVMDDQNLLIIERAYNGVTSPFVITLKKVYLERKKRGFCKTKVVAKFNTFKGWNIDNFEGLTKVAKQKYLMVSDDNGNFFQRTLLVYFEVLE